MVSLCPRAACCGSAHVAAAPAGSAGSAGSARRRQCRSKRFPGAGPCTGTGPPLGVGPLPALCSAWLPPARTGSPEHPCTLTLGQAEARSARPRDWPLAPQAPPAPPAPRCGPHPSEPPETWPGLPACTAPTHRGSGRPRGSQGQGPAAHGPHRPPGSCTAHVPWGAPYRAVTRPLHASLCPGRRDPLRTACGGPPGVEDVWEGPCSRAAQGRGRLLPLSICTPWGGAGSQGRLHRPLEDAWAGPGRPCACGAVETPGQRGSGHCVQAAGVRHAGRAASGSEAQGPLGSR